MATLDNENEHLTILERIDNIRAEIKAANYELTFAVLPLIFDLFLRIQSDPLSRDALQRLSPEFPHKELLANVALSGSPLPASKELLAEFNRIVSASPSIWWLRYASTTSRFPSARVIFSAGSEKRVPPQAGYSSRVRVAEGSNEERSGVERAAAKSAARAMGAPQYTVCNSLRSLIPST